MSELSKRITQDVETQGRLQSLAAQCAGRLAEGFTRTGGSRAYGDVGPSLILAWLEGYAAGKAEELGRAKEKLAAAEGESRALQSRSR